MLQESQWFIKDGSLAMWPSTNRKVDPKCRYPRTIKLISQCHHPRSIKWILKYGHPRTTQLISKCGHPPTIKLINLKIWPSANHKFISMKICLSANYKKFPYFSKRTNALSSTFNFTSVPQNYRNK